MTGINDGDDARTRIAKALPCLAAQALADYQAFFSRPDQKEQKSKKPDNENRKENRKENGKENGKKKETAAEFRARHEAGKAAVAHMKMIAALAKDLAGAAGGDGEEPARRESICGLLDEAERELAAHEQGEKPKGAAEQPLKN